MAMWCSAKVTSFLCFFNSLMRLTAVAGGSEAEIIKALEETQKEVAWKDIPLSGPTIDEEFTRNITSRPGSTAVLNCRIKYLGGKTVSWMRSRDLHLLTVGRFTYTSDQRFQALHQSGSDDWLLKIHYVQHRDAGAYECQVSTTPPLSATVWLTVIDPEARVLGGPALFVNAGSTINLTCVVNHSPDPPPYIFWYHKTELLSYDSPRGGITVVTEHGSASSSRLLIQKASVSDEGKYSCTPANAEPYHVTVHIIPNEHPAAIHHKNGTSSAPSIHRSHCSGSAPLCTLFCFLALLFLLSPISPFGDSVAEDEKEDEEKEGEGSLVVQNGVFGSSVVFAKGASPSSIRIRSASDRAVGVIRRNRHRILRCVESCR